MNILYWWNSLNPLSFEELSLVNQICQFKDNRDLGKFSISSNMEDLYKNLENEYFSRMPFCNCSSDTHTISFAFSGTSFIDDLFKKYVDDETLVISTDAEHPSVKKNLEKVKNRLILPIKDIVYNLKFDKIKKELRNYEKAFVYIIGTQVLAGEITPQIFFIKLRELLKKNRIEYKLVLDDVQGMFQVPRDYSIFDYVLGTGHAAVRRYNLGILISRKFEFGIKAYQPAKDYLDRLKIVLKRQEKLDLFKSVFQQYFAGKLKDEPVFNAVHSVPYIFGLHNDILHMDTSVFANVRDFNANLAPESSKHGYLYTRAYGFITEPGLLEKIMPLFKVVLETDNILKIREVFNGIYHRWTS